mgnify:CR=1 FL=1
MQGGPLDGGVMNCESEFRSEIAVNFHINGKFVSSELYRCVRVSPDGSGLMMLYVGRIPDLPNNDCPMLNFPSIVL